MNALNDNLKFYENYFHGLQEIFNYNSSATEIALGAAKTLSYLLVVPLIIFGVGYLIAKSRVEEATNLCNRVSKMIENQGETTEKIENHQPAKASQEDLVEYLITKLQDEQTDRLDVVFKKLEPKFQGEFFAAAAEKGKLIEAMQLIPKNIAELVFKIGEDLLSYSDFNKAYTITKTLMDELKSKVGEFKELKKISIDLSGSAFYTEKVEWHLKHYLIDEYNNHKENYPYKKFEMRGIKDFHGSGMITPNNVDAAICTALGLANCFCKNDKITAVAIDFKNLEFTAEKIEENWYVTKLIGELGAISWSGLIPGKEPPKLAVYPQKD